MQNQIFISDQGYLPIEDLIQVGRPASDLLTEKWGSPLLFFAMHTFPVS